MVVGLSRAGVCTGARTCGHRQEGWCRRIRSWKEKGTPGAASVGIAGAQPAFVLVKRSSRQHGVPETRSVRKLAGFEEQLHGDLPSLRASS
jgi:hypothetical protein